MKMNKLKRFIYNAYHNLIKEIKEIDFNNLIKLEIGFLHRKTKYMDYNHYSNLMFNRDHLYFLQKVTLENVKNNADRKKHGLEQL